MESSAPDDGKAIYETARQLVDIGLSVLPIKPDGSKSPPLRSWKAYQTRLATDEELKQWFSDSGNGIALVCGLTSSNLECLDIDDMVTAISFPNELELHHPDIFAKVVMVETPRRGLHMWYRCNEPVGPSRKLASSVNADGKSRCLIETRGEGAYALIPPSPADCHELKREYRMLKGSLLRLPVLTAGDREAILRLARSYDRMPAKMGSPLPQKWVGQPLGDGPTPADDFDIRGSWEELLKPYGWSLASGSWESGRLTRPGKERGVSATVGHCKGNHGEPLLHVFSSNAAPLEDGKTYGKYQALRVLKFAGDGSEAMRHLRQEGYGGSGNNGVFLSPLKSTSPAYGSLREIVPAGAMPNDGKQSSIRIVPDVVCAADIEPVAVRWLWPGRIPIGSITLLVGRPGGGKSYLTLDIAARLSRGSLWPDGERAPEGDSLFICAEDDASTTIIPRLIGVGANRNRVHVMQAAKRIEADGKESSVAFDLNNIELILDALEQIPECRLVVIDPIGSYLGGRVDAHRDNEVRAVLAPFAALARERNIAVLLVCHTRKAMSEFADDAVLGSRAFTGLARSVLHLSEDREDKKRKLLLPGKCNLSLAANGLAFRIGGEPTRLQWEDHPLEGLHADDVQPGSNRGGDGFHRGPQPTARSAAGSWLSDFLSDGPKPVSEIQAQAKAAGLSWETVRRAREGLGIEPQKPSFIGGWTWALPDADSRRCSSNENNLNTFEDVQVVGKPEHLRENTGKSADFPPESAQDAQVENNLNTFGENSIIFRPDEAAEVDQIRAFLEGERGGKV